MCWKLEHLQGSVIKLVILTDQCNLVCIIIIFFWVTDATQCHYMQQALPGLASPVNVCVLDIHDAQLGY